MEKMIFCCWLFLFLPGLQAISQKASQNLVYVDSKGVLRYTHNKTEAAFFGVNYTVPFAYGYRSHKALGIDPEKAIDADVYHMARLGLDAFRVHVWDVEISDSSGSLLQNEHLRLFDYLLFKLKQQNIKILVTPIAFWGNGYPEHDVRTNGFSYVYTKGGSVVKEEAFKAQEAYLKQFFQHTNPYTKLTYRDDPDVIAMEINNEPHHSGPRQRTTEYVNRMAAAVRSTGWTKPIFYNISESPSYAGAVTAAKVDGFSFQWYPTALVANHERKGNFLPNVDRYAIPFIDSIPAFLNKARMVYEFDAGDLMQPIMYPAMARSFRSAGFQWATQFAYDPLYTAYGNTEYQTHYLNLCYTPAKAISLLIAAKAFHRLPRGKSYGAYPADTTFEAFRVSYAEQLSEMSSEEEFYYTNTTATQPKNRAKLKHIAGVGSSAVVEYEGTGAYFLDKVEDNVWRLEVMPDAITVKAPFEKASPKKEVVKIAWRENNMAVMLDDLSGNFEVIALDDTNVKRTSALGTTFTITPGVYLLVGLKTPIPSKETLRDKYPAVFFAPPASVTEPLVVHQPLGQVSPGKAVTLSATLAGIDKADKVEVELRHSSGKWKSVPLQPQTGYVFAATVPADMVVPGVLNYRFIVRCKNGDVYTFPGGFKGDPYAWDEYRNESWQTVVAAPQSSLSLFKAAADRSRIMLYNSDWRNNTVEYVTAGDHSSLVWKATMKQPAEGQMMGFQYYFGDKMAGRATELLSFTELVIRLKAPEGAAAKISLITREAQAYAAAVPAGKEWQEIKIPLRSLQPDRFLLLPRPYPGFQPLWFSAGSSKPFSLPDAEKLEIRFDGRQVNSSSPFSVEVESVWLAR